jgi:TP901 family phage tail tape measure protein
MDVATIQIKVDSRQVKSAEKDVEQLGKTGVDTSKKVNDSNEQMAKSAGRAGSAFKLMGAALAAVGAGQVLSNIISQTNQFNKSVSELAAITGATGEDLKFYREQAALIGQTTTLSASQAVTAFQLIASAKPDLLESKEALAGVTAEAVTLAEAASIDLTDAAQTVGVSLNQFGAGAEEASRFVNVLAAGSKFGSSLITETADALKNAGTAASLAGLSFEEANVGIQLLAKGGLFAAEAGTGFRQVLMKLESEADDKFKPSVVGLTVALENLAAENMSLTDIMDMFGAEAAKSAATMINGAESARILEQQLTGTQTATEQAAINFDNLTGDLMSMDSANEALAITIGQKLDPTLRTVTQAVTDFSVAAADFVKSDQFLKYVDLAITGLKILSLIISSQLIASLGASVIAFGKAATAASLFGKALTLMGGPIGATALALFGLFEILEKVVGTNTDNLRRELDKVAVEGIAPLNSHIQELSQRQFELQTRIDATTDSARYNSVAAAELRRAQNELEAVTVSLSEAEDILAEKLSVSRIGADLSTTATGALTSEIEALQQSVEGGLTPALEDVNVETSNLSERIGESDSAMQGMTSTSTAFVGPIQQVTEATNEGTVAFELQKNMLRNLQEDFGDMIYNTLSDGKIRFKDFFDSVVEGFKRMVAELAAQKIMDAIFGDSGLDGFLNKLSGGFSSVISSIASGVGGVVSAATSAVSSVASGAISAITGGAIGGGGSAAAAQSAIAAGTSSMAANAAIGAAATGTAAAAGSAAASQAAIAAGTSTMAANAAAAAGTTAAGGTAASGGIAAAIKAGGAKLGAALFNPVTAAIAAAVAVGHLVDSGGTPTSTAGLTMAKTPGMDEGNIFPMDEFESGFAPLGFKQNATNEQAETAVKPLREIDAALTAMAKEAGFDVDLGGHTFSGLGVEGSGPGTVLGAFVEEGRMKGARIDEQLDNYAAEWINAVGARNNIPASELSRIIGDGTAAGIVDRTAQEMAGILSVKNNVGVMGPIGPEGMGGSDTTISIDGSHRDGLDMVPHDGYVAELHAGERVQTADQARASDSVADEMSGLRQSIEEVMVAVARNTSKLYRLNDRWDKNGLPPVRA